MRVLLDTCVVVDFLQKREPFAQDALSLFRAAAIQEFSGYITAKSATDIFYLSHRATHSNEQSRVLLQRLLDLVGMLDTLSADVRLALLAECADFEDAVMIETAKRSGMDCIVTRNTRHYAGASIPVYEPAEFLRLLASEKDENDEKVQGFRSGQTSSIKTRRGSFFLHSRFALHARMRRKPSMSIRSISSNFQPDSMRAL